MLYHLGFNTAIAIQSFFEFLGANAETVCACISAIATFIAVVIALYQIHDQKKQIAKEEEMSQAKCIAAWFDDSYPIRTAMRSGSQADRCTMLQNASSTPVYEGVVTCVGMYGTGPHHCGDRIDSDHRHQASIVTLPPGQWWIPLPTGGGAMGVQTAVEIAFKDAKGVSRIRRGTGQLEKISSTPFMHYSIPLPVSSTIPQHLQPR